MNFSWTNVVIFYFIWGNLSLYKSSCACFSIAEDVRGHSSGPVALQRWMGLIYSSAAFSGAIKMELHSSAAAFCSLLLVVCFPGLLRWRSCHNKTVQRVRLQVGRWRWGTIGGTLEAFSWSQVNAIFFIPPNFACDCEGGKRRLHHLKHHLKPCCINESQKGWGEEGLMPSLTGFNVVVTSTCAST